jgi:hypothetical protein
VDRHKHGRTEVLQAVQQHDASCIELEPSAVEQRVVERIGVRGGHVEVLEERALGAYDSARDFARRP